jgi:hypothetical protein
MATAGAKRVIWPQPPPACFPAQLDRNPAIAGGLAGHAFTITVPGLSRPARGLATCPSSYSAVAGSISALISEMRSTGNPPRLACSRIMSSLGAR